MRDLLSIGENIWIAEGNCVSFHGFPYPTRSVVVRLASGEVWIWSPIAMDLGLAEDIDRIGAIRHLISPNKIHHLFLRDWKARYPQARLGGPASTIAKRPDLCFEVALTDDAPPVWRDEIDQIWVRGSLFLDEVTFFHRPSRTLILADLSENFSDRFLREHWSAWKRTVARLWKITEPWGYAPLEWRLSFLDRTSLRRAKARWISLDPANVVMAHGEWQAGEGRAYIERAFAWV